RGPEQEHVVAAMAREATLARPLARPLLTRRAREVLTGYLYLLPVVIALGATVVVPIVRAIQMSLYRNVLIKPQEYGFIGLGNYARLLDDDVFWLSLWNSFYWVFGSVSLQFLGGFVAALLLHQSFQVRAAVRTLMLRPIIVVATATRIIWTFNYADLIFVMTSGGPANATQITSTYTLLQAYSNLDFGYAATLSVVLLLIMLAFTLLYLRVTRGVEP